LNILDYIRLKVNSSCEAYSLEAWQIILLSVAVFVATQWLWDFIFSGEGELLHHYDFFYNSNTKC